MSKSTSSKATPAEDRLSFHFPDPADSLEPPPPNCHVTWSDYMDEIEWHLARHLQLHDGPDQRLARKLNERFVL